MRQTVESMAASEAPPDVIWAVAGDFFRPWHPAIASMTAEPRLVRAFTVRGDEKIYRERLTYFSQSDRTYAYAHVAGIQGVDLYNARLTVSPDGGGGSVITMSAELSAPDGRAEEIAAGTQTIFDDGVQSLADVSAPGPAPDPSRKASLGEARLGEVGPDSAITELIPETRSGNTGASFDTLTIDTRPNLTLSVTPPKSGPLCLFLHGIGGARTNWSRQLSATAPITRAAALDLRGYGDSDLGAGDLGEDQTNIVDYCTDILRICEVLRADKLILCGLSYGAWIATSFAMRYPDMLAGLVLSGGCTGMSEASAEEREAFREAREAPLNAGKTPADFAPDVVDVIAGPNASEAARGDLLASMSAIPAATYRDALACFTNPKEKFDFRRLTMPVLMMTGEHDSLAPPDEIRGVAGRIHDKSPGPDVQFEVIEGAGHVCNVEAPDAYNAHLIPFIKRLV